MKADGDDEEEEESLDGDREEEDSEDSSGDPAGASGFGACSPGSPLPDGLRSLLRLSLRHTYSPGEYVGLEVRPTNDSPANDSTTNDSVVVLAVVVAALGGQGRV